LKALAFLGTEDNDEKLAEKAGAKVEEILQEAGVTDAMYTIQIKKKVTEKKLLEDLTLASLDAIFDAGGVSDIE
jgi:molybdopterin biosynthesis enzyme MoaB